MTFATGENSWFRYIVETTAGTTPTTGVMYPTAIISEGLKYNRSKTPSASINSHGQVETLIRQTSNVTGPSAHELRYGEFDDFFESALSGAWSTNVLKLAKTRKTVSIERGLTGITTPGYQLFRGVEADGFSLAVPQDTRKVDFTLNWFGLDETTPVPTSDWVTTNVGVTLGVNPAAAKVPMYLDCGELKQDGVAVAGVTSFNLTVSKGLKSIDTVDCDAPYDIARGQLVSVTGALGLVFDDNDIHNQFLQDTAFTLDLTFTDGTSTYLFTMDACEWSDSERPISGPTELTQTVNFISKYDATLTTSLQITRTP